jgi:hypothetical protein
MGIMGLGFGSSGGVVHCIALHCIALHDMT